jgi:DNA-binding IclR family transcriptional regulator
MVTKSGLPATQGTGSVQSGASSTRLGGEGVKSAARVLAVIRLLTSEVNGAKFGDICEQLKIPKSSAHALLATMTDQGFLMIDSNTHVYRIGVRLWEAGQTYIQTFDLPSIAQPFVEAVRDALGETVQLAILDGIENVYIAKVNSDQRLEVRSRVGSRYPAYATGLGKVLLAGLSDAEIRYRFEGVTLEAFTDRTITELDKLLEIIREIRSTGYGNDDGEYTSNVVCVAVPIRQHSGDVIAAMSVSVPEVRATSESGRLLLDVLLQQAEAMSTALGYRRPSA